MKVSVLIACIGRFDLIERSLYMLSHQTHKCDVFVMDDGSEPGLEPIAKNAGAYYERLRGPLLPGTPDSGGCASAMRHIYYKTDHEFVIVTHPEILVPLDAVERMLDQHESPRRSTPLLYFINKPLLERIDEFPWRTDPHSIQRDPTFMGIWNRWGRYNRDMHEWKHHNCFTGQLREDWDTHNFIPVVPDSGSSDDAWLWKAEHELTQKTGISHYVNQIDLTVYHQFHGPTSWSVAGDELWRVQNYGTPDSPCSPRIRRIRDSVQRQ